MSIYIKKKTNFFVRNILLFIINENKFNMSIILLKKKKFTKTTITIYMTT